MNVGHYSKDPVVRGFTIMNDMATNSMLNYEKMPTDQQRDVSAVIEYGKKFGVQSDPSQLTRKSDSSRNAMMFLAELSSKP